MTRIELTFLAVAMVILVAAGWGIFRLIPELPAEPQQPRERVYSKVDWQQEPLAERVKVVCDYYKDTPAFFTLVTDNYCYDYRSDGDSWTLSRFTYTEGYVHPCSGQETRIIYLGTVGIMESLP